MGSRASPPPPSGCGACSCLPTLWSWIRSSAGSLRWRRSSPRARATSGPTCGSPDACGRRSSGSRVAGTSRALARVRVCTAPSMGSGARWKRRCCNIPTAAFPSSRVAASPRPHRRRACTAWRSAPATSSCRGAAIRRRAHRPRERLPGNFSQVGLVHVDSASHAASVIEAHIERGVAVSTADGYLRDKKLRIMVLRLRADLAPLIADPSLPHRAASLALERARSGHIAYDFEMDYTDPSRLFCSEAASSVYGELGVRLWTGLSTISAAGLRRWPSALRVRHLATQEPSELEYDPQLVVVAEWRDAGALMQDHIDNA